MSETVAIVGGGASGVLTAAHLLAHTTHRVIVIEPGNLGRGVAYSTPYMSHLLNVPASKMSAFADDTSNFSCWLDRHYPQTYGTASFVPRSIYGEYLSDTIARCLRDYPGRIAHVGSVAVDLERNDDGLRIICANGDSHHADRCIIATGHAEQTRAARDAHVRGYFRSAWVGGALTPDDLDEPVAILGSGLTAVDAVLALRDNGHRGSISLISTRGLLPHEHRATADSGWRASVDGLRPVTNARWQSMSLVEQRRFLRHFASYWNVHRHRMAPQIARAIGQLLADGTLSVTAARVRSVTATSSGMRVCIRLRGSHDERTLDVARVIDCTGSDQDLRKTSNPFLRSLLDHGMLTPHPLGVGSSVASNGALIDRYGNASAQLFAIGPLRFGSLFETTAIPEIRTQAHELARTLEHQMQKLAEPLQAKS